MGIDASQRDWSHSRFADATWKWVVGGLGLWIVAFPAYLALRGKRPLKAAMTSGGAMTDGGAVADGWSEPPASGSVPPPAFRACPKCRQPARDGVRECAFCGTRI